MQAKPQWQKWAIAVSTIGAAVGAAAVGIIDPITAGTLAIDSVSDVFQLVMNFFN